jgi:pimeloyl-ACP methyl ester carboxylesterase
MKEADYVTGEILDGEMIRLHYYENRQAGPPLVLIHGLTGSAWKDWGHLIPQIPFPWRVFAVDLRGHGRSCHPERGYHYDDYTRDIAAFLRGLVRKPVLLIGHSLGAVISLLTAAEAPEQVRGLLLSDPPLFAWHTDIKETGFARYFGWVEQTLRSVHTFEELCDRTRQAIPDASEETIQSLARDLSQVSPEAPGAALRNQTHQGIELAAVLGKITCPTVFLRGEKALGSAMWDEDEIFVRAHLPQAEIQSVTGTGHGTNMQEEIILAWLKEQDRAHPE